jgi:hypothetical protein
MHRWLELVVFLGSGPLFPFPGASSGDSHRGIGSVGAGEDFPRLDAGEEYHRDLYMSRTNI